MRYERKRWSRLGMALITLAAAAAFVASLATSTSLRSLFRDQRAERGELLRFASSLQLGMTPEEIRKAYGRGAFSTFTLRDDGRTWYVTTPLRFGSTNWWILLEFEAERLRCIRYRSEDTLKTPPSGAPPDLCRVATATPFARSVP